MELDKDLQQRQQARELVKQAQAAQEILSQMPQQQLDEIVYAMSKAFSAAAVELAELAVQETGFGNSQDKITKNRFASRTLWDAIKDMKAVGVLKEDAGEKAEN